MCWGRWKTSRAKKGGSSSSVHTVEKHSMRTTWFRSESGVIRPREPDRGRRRGKGSLMKDGKDREREREVESQRERERESGPDRRRSNRPPLCDEAETPPHQHFRHTHKKKEDPSQLLLGSVHCDESSGGSEREKREPTNSLTGCSC